MLDIVVNFISILSNVLWLAIFVRALMSWVMPKESGGLLRVLVEITEPVLAPIRRVLPPLGGFDLSPIVAIIAIQIVSQVLIRMIVNSA